MKNCIHYEQKYLKKNRALVVNFSSVLFFLLILLTSARSETLNFRHYTVKEGLANSTVYSVFQDSKGFIWLATESGVNRFDGHKFELFTMDNGLSDNEVLEIREDSSGRIWFLTLNGKLSYFYNKRFYNPSNDALLKKSISPGSFISFYEDERHNLWFTTNQNRVLKIDPQKNIRYFSAQKYTLINCFITQAEAGEVLALNKKYAHSIKNNRLTPVSTPYLPISPKSFLQNPDDRSVIFLSDKGLVQYKAGRFSLRSAPLKGLNNSSVGSLMTDDQKRLWVGTMGEGILLFKSLAKEPEKHLKGENITHIMKDREGNTWIATIGSGVFMLPFYAANAVHLTTRDGLNSDAITRVIKVKDQLILGLRSGNLDIVQPTGITHKVFNSSNTYNPVKKLYYDSKRNSIWYASDNRLMELNPLSGDINVLNDRKPYAIKSFSFSNSGDLAIAHSSGVYITRSKGSLPAPPVHIKNSCFLKRAFTVYYDSGGKLWFSNLQGLQYYYQGKVTELYKHIPVLRQRVTDIAELPGKTLIFTTYGFGVVVLKDDKLVRSITTANGLASNICKKVFVENNKAWIVTGKGISVVDFSDRTSKVTSYNTENGLLSDEVNDVFARNDTAYVASNNGLSVFKPVVFFKRAAPALYLNSIQINKKVLKPGDYPFLSHDQNNITVSYIALDYAHPSRIHYRYRLHHQSRWFDTQGNTLEFGSLEPGKYELEIKGKSLGTPWSQPVRINLTIHSPFWKTWWFIFLTVLSAALLLFFLIRYYFRMKQAGEKEKLITKTRIISLEQQALQAMMNPHFIFNVMNSIQYFINTKENTMANQALTGFARLIRKNLEVCNKSYISIEEEISYLSLYLSLEKLRFGEKMNYTIEVDKEIDLQSTFIPSMLLQPYVENAIWHGIMPKESEGNILIDVRKTGDYLRIRITDDGIGIENSQKQKKTDHISRGMQLTMQRINLINKFKKRSIDINVRQVAAGGTEVLISLPLTVN